MELQRVWAWTRKFSLLMCSGEKSHSDYMVSLQIKVGTAMKKNMLKTSQAFGSQVHFPVHLVQLGFDII